MGNAKNSIDVSSKQSGMSCSMFNLTWLMSILSSYNQGPNMTQYCIQHYCDKGQAKNRFQTLWKTPVLPTWTNYGVPSMIILVIMGLHISICLYVPTIRQFDSTNSDCHLILILRKRQYISSLGISYYTFCSKEHVSPTQVSNGYITSNALWQCWNGTMTIIHNRLI